jgi:hypothetical protein
MAYVTAKCSGGHIRYLRAEARRSLVIMRPG